MKIILLMTLLILGACGKQSSKKLYPITEETAFRYVNQKEMPEDPNITLEKSIVNTSYPIQISLYSDGQFYYDLPNLGDGKGTWKLSDGKFKLKAKRTLFDMHIEITGNDQEVNNVSVQFTDRFGPNTLEMSNVNI